MSRPYENLKPPLCFEVKDNYDGVTYCLRIIDMSGDMFVINLETEIIDTISAKFDDILTAVNAYPVLVAENAELKAENERMKSIINKIMDMEELDINKTNGEIEGIRDMWNGTLKIMKHFVSPAVEGVKK